MKKMICFVIMLAWISEWSLFGEQSQSRSLPVLPAGLSLGMSRTEVEPSRSKDKWRRTGAGSRNTNAVVFAEMTMNGPACTSYLYHFIDDRLRAVTLGIYHAGKRDEQEVRKIHESLAKEFAKQKDEKIVRLEGNLQKVIVNAELWKSKTTEECSYFVDTTNDTTAILFDPKYFGAKDFFVTAEEMPGEVPGVESIRKAVNESRGNTNREPSQAPTR